MIHTRIVATFAATCALVGLAGCGGGDGGDLGPPPSFTTQILTDPSFDGDIEQVSPGSYTVTQGMSANVQSVLAGIDPVGGTEFRAFLDFPLGGQGGVPADAVIDSAFLEVYVDDLQPDTSTLPLRVELVTFQPPTLIPTDFDRSAQPPLAAVTISPPINHADIHTYVSIDVTALMVEAQRRRLPDFQVRIMEDLGTAIESLMAIDDTTGPDRSKFAPVLTVTYF
jgi:hypothetical protein